MDINEIRAKLKGLEGGRPQKLIWKPKDEHTVRLLPLPGEADITEAVNWHYGVDEGRKLYCPSTVGDACAFCDLGQVLRSWKDDKGRDKQEADRKRDWDWFKKIQAANKHYAPIIVRKAGGHVDDFEGPFWWEMSPKTRERLLTIASNDDYNEEHADGGGSRILTSLTHGLDLIVTLKKAGQTGNQTTFDLTEVDERRKCSPRFKERGKKAAEEVLKGMPPLSEAIKTATTADAEKAFRSYEASLSGDAPPPDASSGVEHGPATNSSENALSGGKSVEEILKKLDSLIPQKQQQQG